MLGMKFLKSKAFTVVELIIAIIIIAILAGVAVTYYTDLTGEAEASAALSQTANIRAALAQYIGANSGTLPTVGQLANMSNATAGAGVITTTAGGKTYTTVLYASGCGTGTPTAATASTDSVECIGATTAA